MQTDFNTDPEIELDSYKWMPSLSIILNTRREEIISEPAIMTDYFNNGNKIDLNDLENYISIVMDIHKRIDGKDYHNVYKM